MNVVNATFAKQNFGSCLMNVAGEPILIEKSGNPAAVLLSYDEYNRLLNIEDDMLLMRAIDSASKGFLDENDSLKWFNNMEERFFKNKNIDSDSNNSK